MQEKISSDYSLTQYLTRAIAVLFIIYFWKIVHDFWIDHAKLMKAVKNFPGPPTIPLLGNALDFAKNIRDALNVMMEFGKKYPTYRIWVGPRLFIVISSPKDLEIVMKSPKTAKKSFAYDFMGPIVSNSLINGYGPKMRANRKMEEPLINGEPLTSYMKTFNEQTLRYVDAMSVKVDLGEFDMYQETEYCVADIVFETLIGIPGVGQEHGELTLPHAMEVAIDILYQRSITPWLQPSFLFNLTKRGRTYNNILDLANEILCTIIKDKRQLYMALARNELGVEKPKPSILDMMMENIMETNTMTDKEIISDIIALFVGFYDAVLGIYSFVMLMLAMHPEAQMKVRDEVMSVLGINDDVVDENIGKLKYTNMVIKEAIRLFPVGPLLAREVTEDLQIDKYILPKGATVAMLPLLTHRSKEHWDEPDKFIPERFLPENCKDRHPYAYVPFSGGSRTCPASKFGTACLKVMVAHFIRNYQLTTKMKLESLRLTTHISIRSLDGFKVSITKIDRTRL